MRIVSVFIAIGYLASLAMAGGGGWVEFADETATRLVAAPPVGVSDPAEKDYAWGDVDKDGDIDIVCVRKTESSQPCSVDPSLCNNVLFMNEGVAEGHAINGVFVDRTAEYATDADDGGQGFFDITNDRDVILVDVNGDTWLDIVTATTISDGLPKTISHPRVYINKGLSGGAWQGFRYEEARIPQMFTIPAGLAVAPRFCAVAAGRVTNDNAPDLYFGDYDNGATAPPMPSGHDVNDRLLINDGNGFFTDSLQTRMTAEMLESAFAMAVAIEDMNNDGVSDIVKDTALNVPQRISVSYNDPDNEGFFDNFDVVIGAAPYHISVGDLNQDGLPDIVVTDDGTDFYMLNQGPGADGAADFISFNFNSGGGFGGNSVIADLNNDGHNDALITDHDVDFFGCGGRMHIYRNLGNLPSVTMQEQGGAAPWTPQGTHDVAVFDMNGDGWLDMFIGTCNTAGEKGHEIWINQPPFGVVFSYPQGLPGFVLPKAPFTFQMQATAIGGATLVPGSGVFHLSINGGVFSDVPMTSVGPDLYEATIPASACTDRFSFYFSVELEGLGTFVDPPGAPGSTYAATAAASTLITLREEFEGDVSGWTVTSVLPLDGGAWEQADPNGTVDFGNQAAPGDDATAGAGNVMAFVTQNGVPGGAANASDVDGGPTRLMSPTIDLSGTDANISYARWLYSRSGVPDQLIVEVSSDGGSSWALVAAITGTDSAAWVNDGFLVGDFVTPTATVNVRFSIADSPSDSVTEAGIDNFQVERFICQTCDVNADCVDANPCTDALCSHGACLFVPNSASCDDGAACTQDDVCSGGACNGTSIPGCVACAGGGDCDDGNLCTDDACVLEVCQFTPNAVTCDDGDICTENDTCSAGICTGSFIPDCADCLVDLDCDDTLFCNGQETCAAGACVAGVDPCQGLACDENTDTCELALQPRMGDPMRGLTAGQLERFLSGQVQFNRGLLESEGLGPVFNQNSCASCHSVGGSGGSGTIMVTRFGASSKQGFDPLAALGGSLLQAQSISDQCAESVPPEADVVTNRTTPSIFGGGLVQAISDAALLANANNAPANISGIAHMVSSFEDPPGSPLRVGRFGWKAQVATLLTFAADAGLNEMGLTNRFILQENAPNGDVDLLASCDNVADPEDGFILTGGADFIDQVADFQRFLSQPPQTPQSGMTGEALFVSVGCADCHTPSFVTGTAPEAALTGKLIKPYSDFLLHDMGLLGDGIVQGAGTEREMRTSALWGLRVRDPMLHDGLLAGGGTFAQRVTNAIAAHDVFGSEAQPSAASFFGLSPVDGDAIIAFLDSLGRAEFDHNGDGEINHPDFIDFAACFTGPGSSYTPDDPCSISDIDQDGDVDEDDFALFLTAYTGPQTDCNDNGTLDIVDIIAGASPDTDGDGLLDQCSAPAAAPAGGRYVAVTPAAGPDPIAILATSADFPCLSKYVAADGSLADVPVFQTPVAWGEVLFSGTEVVPGRSYHLQAEFGGGSLTDLASVTTWIWGDVDDNGAVNLGDALVIVQGFQGDFSNASLEAVDLWPCAPDGIVNFEDIQRAVLAFQGQTYSGTGCPDPCE